LTRSEQNKQDIKIKTTRMSPSGHPGISRALSLC
jgi:hypothetical protein